MRVDVYNYHLEGGDDYPEQARLFKCSYLSSQNNGFSF